MHKFAGVLARKAKRGVVHVVAERENMETGKAKRGVVHAVAEKENVAAEKAAVAMEAAVGMVKENVAVHSRIYISSDWQERSEKM